MARPAGAFASRNEEIIRRLTVEKQPYTQIIADYGLSMQQLRTICREGGVEPPARVRAAAVDRKPVSALAGAMGMRLHGDRMHRNMTLSEYSLFLGLSTAKLSDALQGLHDWRLDEAIRVAKRLDLKFEDFIKPPGGI